MDETEISNLDYREYLYWLERVFVPADLKEVYDRACPDENVWREKLTYAEPQVEYYFRYPAYNHYPVVGVSWLQATNYAAWRTDRVNELMLVEAGVLDWDPTQPRSVTGTLFHHRRLPDLRNLRNGDRQPPPEYLHRRLS